MNFPEGDEDGDLVKGNLEKCDVDRNESREESQENDLSMKPKLSSEFASSLPESQIFADDIMDVPVKEFPERESMHLHGVPYSSRIGNNSVSDTGVKDELKGDNKVGLESLSISTPTEYDGGDVDSLEKPFEDHRTKESRVSPIEDKSSVPVSAIAEDNHARELGGSAAEITSGSLEGDSNFVKQHIGASTVDVSVDSYSQADSLEGNWGSVSVLSIQSDAAAVIDAETLPSSDNQALAETEAAHSEKPKAVPERQPSDKSDKSDMFEAPSFMTLVEPRDGAGQKAAVSEVQTGQNRQQQSASLQAGWFPSLSHVANESPGRKKNEEIIAKVTNWSTGKQHTPLKSLLSQASFESKQKSKKPKENPASALQNDETLSKDNGATSTALYTVLGPESPTTQAAKTEPKKEWSSPARYPSEIKTEKRKVKGRPYWVPFVCCSSVN
ncbi:hypothetical protein CJ030_MR5G003427 [Morella rubra]|uniref:Uncharacterized protein n=1 Tax=Morella rubra TaxID=262757 RepID=A0A6A1VL92_9ROSI|nr:hypothetical protein CJ030_MR5G003427 [Morella rubra]